MAKTIGDDSKNRQCQNCGEPFEWPEFSAYMLRLRSSTIDCLRCQTENYIIPKKGLVYFVLLTISSLIGIAFFLGVQLAVAIGTYNEYEDSFKISFLAIAFGFIVGLGIVRITLNILHWFTGTMSTDRKHKSMADYE